MMSQFTVIMVLGTMGKEEVSLYKLLNWYSDFSVLRSFSFLGNALYHSQAALVRSAPSPSCPYTDPGLSNMPTACVIVFLYHKKHMKMKGEPNTLLIKINTATAVWIHTVHFTAVYRGYINSNATPSLLETCTTPAVAIQTILLTS